MAESTGGPSDPLKAETKVENLVSYWVVGSDQRMVAPKVAQLAALKVEQKVGVTA